MKRKKLTDESYSQIPALVEQGITRDEIAAKYGVTRGTLLVQCSRHGISLRKGGFRPRQKKTPLPPLPPLSLSDKALLALRTAAKARGKDDARLASDLLETIAKDDLYKAVLDTSKEPVTA